MKELTNEKLQNRDFGDNLKNMSKACLSSYSLLPEIIKSIDSLVVAKASATVFLPELSDIEKYGDEIISLSNKKIALINLKVLMDESLNGLSDNAIRLISARFIDGLRLDTCLKLFNLSERSFYRKVTKALDTFSHIFFKKLMKRDEVASVVFEGSICDTLKKIDEFQTKNGISSKNKTFICEFIARQIGKV